MQKQKMLLTETEHAGILAAFYKVLTQTCGQEQGTAIFMTAGRAYGSRRGRRMALRALRDGNPLDMTSYFAYGELLCTDDGHDGTYTASEGCVHEQQLGCKWAAEFRAWDCLQCGVDYCREIDGTIVRGFNPTLAFECTQNMHTAPSCDFYYRGPEIKADFMQTYESRLREGEAVKREMGYHCADVYQMYVHVVSQALPQQAAGILEAVRRMLAERYGGQFFDLLSAYDGTDFENI